ncbi:MULTISPECIES: response regulator [Nostocales]|uniref:Response regulator n=3 Tax=Nostocales TaxID=1161 RepID=A0A8S9T1V9_9CYAN|nr:response regulator [Tolypothrix bouteillei]KAF3885453.1 response regulator [Tolypothrix bouteillei VB521301]
MKPEKSDCDSKDSENNSQSVDRLRVLVVDDDVDSCIFMRFILESFNFQVMTASKVMEAVELMVKFQPNLLISDIVMPQINGYTLIRKVRTLNPPLGQIPAIAVTGLDLEEGRNFALRYGFQAYLIKPIAPDELILLIEKLIKSPSNNQLQCENSSKIITTKSFLPSQSKQVDKLPIETTSLHKNSANQIIIKTQQLRTQSKQLKIRYNDLGCRFVVLRALFAQSQRKFGRIKLYQ